jgi:hypothetical protein
VNVLGNIWPWIAIDLLLCFSLQIYQLNGLVEMIRNEEMMESYGMME